MTGGSSRFEAWLTRGRALLVNLAVIVATGFVSIIVVSEVVQGTYLIEPISVPESFQKDVQDKEGVAARLRDAIGLLSQRARDHVAIRPVVRDPNEPVVSLTGTTFSVRDLATMIREHSWKPYPIITGELSAVKSGTDDGNPGSEPHKLNVSLTLRLSGSANGPFFSDVGDYDAVIGRAAIATLRVIDPFTAASAHAQGSGTDRLQALAWIKEGLSRMASDDPSMPRAKLALANVLLATQRYHDAIAAFGEANQAYAELHHRREWYAAYDGIATADLLVAQNAWSANPEQALATLSQAEQATSRSLDLAKTDSETHDYDSALYHRAQIYDARATHWFASPYRGDCFGFGQLHLALDAYDALTRRYPGFADAYSNKAMLLAQELKWFRTKRVSACGALPTDLALLEADRLTKIRSLFDETVARDSNASVPWLQGGILLYEQQKPGFPMVDAKPEDRLAFLEFAITKLKRATQLLPADPYVWQRLAETMNERTRLKSVGSAADGDQDAAYCRAAALAREQAGSASLVMPDELDRAERAALDILAERAAAGFAGGCRAPDVVVAAQ